MLFVIYSLVITVMFCFPNLTIKVWSKNSYLSDICSCFKSLTITLYSFSGITESVV